MNKKKLHSSEASIKQNTCRFYVRFETDTQKTTQQEVREGEGSDSVPWEVWPQQRSDIGGTQKFQALLVFHTFRVMKTWKVGLAKSSKAERSLLDNIRREPVLCWLGYVLWRSKQGEETGMQGKDGDGSGDRVVRESLLEEVKHEQSPEGSEKVSRAGVRKSSPSLCVSISLHLQVLE